ncbi:hypothetical protein, partial [Helicobacter jaachi]|uniref:putative barnase/colicin E5 family endoribonuclease n=1 Tax=Helicobacter jaachi TaxID=1677920 RepID=UPI001883B6BE
FHKEGLGDIDLVWGEVTDSKAHKGYGLAHIIDKHPDFDVKLIPEIIENGKVVKSHNGYNIDYGDYRVGLNIGWNKKGVKEGDNVWVVTTFERKNQGGNSDSFTKGETLPLNSSADSSIESKITQDSIESTESKALESSAKEVEQNLENVPESASVIEGNNIKINALQAQRDKAIQEMTRQVEEFLSLKEQAYDKARAKLKGKPRYSHSEFQAQVEKEELYTKALTYKQNAQELSQKINALESKIGELIEANYVLNKTSLTQMLANTTDEAQKIQIVKPYLKHQIKLNEKEVENLENILKNRDYFAHEISQKLHALQENAELKNLGKDELLNLAKEHLDMDYFNKIKELQRQIKLTRSKISRLDFDYKRSHYAPNKRRLIKNLAQIEKQILKEVDLKALEERLTYDLNTKEGVEKVRELFLSGVAKDEEQKALFERVLPIAQKLGVQVRHAINDASLSQKVLGLYNLDENLARVKYNKTIVALKGQTLLHELIHSVTSRALIAYERGFRDILSPNQIKAIENLESIYKQVYENREALGLKAPIKDEKSGTLLKGDYALENTHEFLAELSNPTFREKLKTIGVFEKIINAITKLFVALTKRDKAEYSAYKATKEALFEIIDNYNPNFSKAYEDLPLRGGEVESIKSKKDSMLESKLVSNQGKNMDFIYKTSEVKTFKELRNNTKEILSNITHENIQNKETGIIAKITGEEIKKMISKAAVDKSLANGFTKEEHFALCNDIKNLFINAKLREKHKDLHGRNNITTHRFAINTIVNGKKAIAKITAHVRKVGNNKIYSLELENIVKPAIKD